MVQYHKFTKTSLAEQAVTSALRVTSAKSTMEDFLQGQGLERPLSQERPLKLAEAS